MKKKEFLFVAGILVFALALWLVLPLLKNTRPAAIRITVAEQEYGTYSLSEDQIIPIGTTNVCEIKDGAARMLEADCPDQLCMHQTAITADHGGLIVCLPNQIIIEGVHAPEESSVDAVA